ncbi:MFS transporter [Chromobacterium subtsugae]|uniref:MFS transporter n=1 Tax=Chromobacterium subtsugae TaxID=251747 RepID=UPI000AD59436|nr:MFS transporter [Chromobacterium subtsugae]
MKSDNREAGAAPSAAWAVASLALTMLMPSLDTSIANAGLPALAQALDATFQQAQWIVLAYLLAVTTLIVSVGRLGDLLGRRRLLLAGIALFTAASLLCGLAATLPALIAARAAQGLGAAVMMALAIAMAGEAAAQGRTGSAMGLLGSMSAIGTTLGPSLGGLLTAGLGWRAIFLVNVPLGLVNFALARRYLPSDRRAAKPGRQDFDPLGTLLLALTLAAYALAMTQGQGRFGALGGGLLLAAAAGAALFIRVEARAASPLLQPAMLRQPELAAGLAMSALVSTVIMSTLVVGPFYLSRALGLEAARVGLALSVGPLLSACCGVPAGRLVDRFGGGRVSRAGLLGMLGGTLLLALLPSSLGIFGYLCPMGMTTAGYALFQAANNTALMANAGAARRGVAAGMLSLSRNLGLITGAAALGAVFAAASAHSGAGPEEAAAAGMRATFAAAALLVAAALAISTAGQARARRLLAERGG